MVALAKILEALTPSGNLADGADAGLESLFGYLISFFGVSNLGEHVLSIGFSSCLQAGGDL